MSDQSTPEPAGQVSAPSEQPYYVPTAHQQAWSAAQQHPGQPCWSPPPVAAKPRPRRLLMGSVAAASVTALAVGGIAVAVDRSALGSSQQATITSPNSQNPFGQNGSGQDTPYRGGFGGASPDNGSGSSGATGTRTTGPATAAQQVGVVNITTTVNYGQGRAAGTGIVLSRTARS